MDPDLHPPDICRCSNPRSNDPLDHHSPSETSYELCVPDRTYTARFICIECGLHGSYVPSRSELAIHELNS